MNYAYKPGDIFVSAKQGVITILEVQTHSGANCYKCKVYDKATVQDKIEHIWEYTFKTWRDYNIYKFYPVKE